MSLGPTELIIILIIVLLLFGTTRLPKLARSLGEASKEFKKGVNEQEQERERAAAAAAATPPAPAPPAPPVAPTVPPAAAPPPAPPAPAQGSDEQVTMSRAELDALLAERERQARDIPPPAQG
ncbi:MAG: twin-arginine translocation protein TatA/E family subunit [Acidimicrobiales bacterium]|nr:twin-arginine translocation protein TatA/E family subunit [Acidimicrobiales bacterium]